MKKFSSLQKGGTIAIISPAGPIKDERALYRAVDYINSKGFNVILGDNVLARADYLAGADELRVKDLHNAFSDKDIKAVLCARGGYGATRLLDLIDYDLLKENPKLFLGYSDITAFLNAFPDPCFHAPMAVSDFGLEIDDLTSDNFFEVIQGIKPPYLYAAKDDFQIVNPGFAKGILRGGNLTVLTSLMGTKYFPDVDGSILLLEDLNEEQYKLDRMFTQLRLAGVFEQVSGVVFAGFGDTKVTVEFLRSFLPDDLPAIYGFMATHDTCKYTLPIGAEYKFDANAGTLELFEDIFA
jgi:muramoyltetrapeptide carboxypeptidase